MSSGWYCRWGVVCALLPTSALSLAGQAGQAGEAPIPRLETGPDIDGRLDDWPSAALRVPLPFEWFPGDNVAPKVATACYLGLDDRALYFGCQATDSAPDAVRARYADRDAIGGDDQITILLDPFNTSRRAYQFTVTALGIQGDALYSEETGSDDTWDAVWQSAGRINEHGYVVEAAIPLAVLRLPAGARGNAWRIVIQRAYPRSADHLIGSITRDRNNNCLLCQGTIVTGVASVRSRRDVVVQPTVTGVVTKDETGSGTVDSESEVRVGVSGRWGITSATRLNATINPDFSQVEADAAEFEVNRRFALTFDEKRPFFLDGRDFFDVPQDLVFTRSVVDPIGGAKFTGAAGRHGLGAFVALDRATSIVLPGNRGSDRVSLDQDVFGGVARYRVDMAHSSSIGGVVTSRLGANYHNAMVGVDGAIRFARSHRVSYVAAGSHTDDAPQTEQVSGRSGAFGGWLWNVRYDLDLESWAVEVRHRGISRGFRDDAGLVQRVDLVGPEVQVTRVFWGDNAGWFDRIAWSFEVQHLTDFGGGVIDQKVQASASYEGPLQSRFEVERAWRREAFGQQLFSRGVTEVGLEIRPLSTLALTTSGVFGDEFDTDNLRLGRGLELGIGAEVRPGRAVRLDGRARYQTLSVDAGRVFRAYLSEARVEYHFGSRTFVRAIVQHRLLFRDPVRYVEPVTARSNRLFSQFLFSYQLNLETVLFVGYSGTARDFTGLDIRPRQRAFFVKLGYGVRP